VRSVDVWTVFYGTFVGMMLMILASVATVLFQVLELSSPSVTIGPEPGALFYRESRQSASGLDPEGECRHDIPYI
jgi:hypothetical protein